MNGQIAINSASNFTTSAFIFFLAFETELKYIAFAFFIFNAITLTNILLIYLKKKVSA